MTQSKISGSASSSVDTVVVGGGIAGLCAAAHLSERGVSVTVLERNPRSLGGRIASAGHTVVRIGDDEETFDLEHGVHGWWRQYRNFLAFYDRYHLTESLVPAYDQALIYRDAQDLYRVNVGRRTQVTRIPEPFHHLPLFTEPVFRRLLKGRELRKMPRLARRVAEILRFDPNDSSARARYDARPVQSFLPGMPVIFQAFLRSLSRSGFFSDPPEVSLWAFLVSLQLYVFLRKEDQTFHFTRGTIARFFSEPVADVIRQRGGRIETGTTVHDLTHHPRGGWRVGWRRDTEEGTEEGVYHARHLILAVDVEGAKALAKSSRALREVVGDLSVFHGRRSTNVRLWWSQSPSEKLAESGVLAGRFTADNYFWLHRIQDKFRVWHERTGGSASECHIYAPASLHDEDDETLMDRVQSDMEAAFPGVAGSCVHRAIVRNEATHINFPVGCAERFPKVKTSFPDLSLAGDWVDGGAPVLYMERACQTGLQAANNVLSARGLPAFDVLYPEQAPRHVRFIQRLLRGGRSARLPEANSQPSEN